MRQIVAILFGLSVVSCGGADSPPPAEPAPPHPTRDDPNPPTALREQAELLLADRLAVRHPSDGGGRAWIESIESPYEAEDTVIRAGERRRFTIVYEAGDLGVSEGGSVHFMPEPYWGWSVPQSSAPDRLGFTSVTTEKSGVRLEAARVGNFQAGYLVIRILDGALEAGDCIRIEYGAGPSYAQVDRHAERGSRLWLYVDGDGDGVRGLLKDSPAVDIHPGPPSRLVLLGPSVVRPGGTVEMKLSLLDVQANRAFPQGLGTDSPPLEARILNRPPEWEVPERVTIGGDGTAEFSFTALTPGILRLEAEVDLDGRVVRDEAPPTWVNADAPLLLWGDLHGHSGLSDGTGTPLDWYGYARDVAGLDFAALTDHDHFGIRFLDDHPELWADIQLQAEAFNAPGHFVALLGFEWTNWVHGHRHVVYFGKEGRLLSSLDEDTDDPRELWSALAGEPVLTFAHHSSGEPVPTNWTFTPDPVLEPLTEIVSVHGSSEALDAPRPVRGALRGNQVRDVLTDGVRLGFVGSGDSHDGHPGLAHLSAYYGWRPESSPGAGDERVGTAGLTALQCPELSRASILEALRDRRTYATSGPRMLLWVRLNEYVAGSIIPITDLAQGAELDLTILGTAPLKHVDLIRSGTVQRMPLELERAFQGSLRVENLESGEYLYLRVEQEDGGTAWTSPFFIGD